MPQFIRPDSDLVRNAAPDGTVRSGSVPTLSTGATAFGVIDEVTSDDTDYFESTARTFGNIVAVGLGDPDTTPTNDRNHFITFRCGKDVAGERMSLNVQLRQAYASETSQGTLIASTTVDDVPNTPTTYRYRLATTEAEDITNYNNLQLRFRITRAPDGSSNTATTVRVYWAEVELPLNVDQNIDLRLSHFERTLQQRGESLGARLEDRG